MKDVLKQISISDLMAFGGAMHALKERMTAADQVGAAVAAQEVLLQIDQERIARGLTGDAEHERFFREALEA